MGGHRAIHGVRRKPWNLNSQSGKLLGEKWQASSSFTGRCQVETHSLTWRASSQMAFP